jgi:hypothetical protein
VGEDPDTVGDTIDEDAKADGATFPGGYYELSTDLDDEPRLEELDLRPNKTYYRTFAMLTPGDPDGGNFEIGYSYDRGTFKFSSNSATGKKYIRFYDLDNELIDVWRYTFDGSKLKFLYRTEGGFDMKRVAAPTKTWVNAVKARLTTPAMIDQLAAVDIYATGVAQSMRSTYIDYEQRTGTAPKLGRARVDYKYAYVVSSANTFEVFAASGQLIAAGKRTATTITWDPAL